MANFLDFLVLTFYQYLIPIVGLFQGRIVDMPDHPMAPTAYSSGGAVEHKVSVFLNIC